MKTFLRICVVVLGAACFASILMRYRTYLQFMFSDWGDVQRSRQGSVKSLVHVEPERNTSSLDKQKWPKCSSLRPAAAGDLRFNFSIPLLMWAGDLDYSVNKQLMCCPLPYGLKDVPPQVVNDALTLLNEPSSNQLFDRGSLPCIRCAVVGNGGILNGSRQGKTIDSHHFVFRVNGAVTKGFEQDVGTKTSFYGFSTNSMKNSLLAYKKAGFDSVPQDQNASYVFIPDDVRDFVMLTAAIKGISVPSGKDMGDWPPTYFGAKHTVSQFKILHPEFINYVTQQFLKSPQMFVYPDIYMPTTGGLMLMLALHTCDQVSAYGFITENFIRYSDHYFDSVMKPLVFYANHDIRMEAALWAEFHTKEIMWLYHR